MNIPRAPEFRLCVIGTKWTKTTGTLVSAHLVDKGVKQAQQSAKHRASSVLTHRRWRREHTSAWAPDDEGTILDGDCASGTDHN